MSSTFLLAFSILVVGATSLTLCSSSSSRKPVKNTKPIKTANRSMEYEMSDLGQRESSPTGLRETIKEKREEHRENRHVRRERQHRVLNWLYGIVVASLAVWWFFFRNSHHPSLDDNL